MRPAALFRFSDKNAVRGCHSEADTLERKPRPDTNAVFERVSKGSKKRMELARGIEPPTG